MVYDADFVVLFTCCSCVLVGNKRVLAGEIDMMGCGVPEGKVWHCSVSCMYYSVNIVCRCFNLKSMTERSSCDMLYALMNGISLVPPRERGRYIYTLFHMKY